MDAGDELVHGLRLGFRERSGAAVVLGRRGGAGARAAPVVAVVAIQIDARLRAQRTRDRRLGLVGGLAVLALVLAGAADQSGGSDRAGGRAPGDEEAVDVDHR